MTKTFKLLSGVECEITEFTGKHQRIMSEQKKKKLGENMLEVLQDIIVRVGSINKPGADFVTAMLAGDKKKILIEARQFSLGAEDDSEDSKIFKFTYSWVDRNGQKQTTEFDLDLTTGFPEHPYYTKNPDGTLTQMDYKEYSEINKKVMLLLPRVKKEVQWEMLDGRGEQQALSIKRDDRSSHTKLELRNPIEFMEGSTGKIPLKLNLDQLTFRDIEALRADIHAVEGDVDTFTEFDHPEADTKMPSERTVKIDLISQIAFFFPSERI